MSLTSDFNSKWLFIFFQITMMLLFAIALIYSNRIWVSRETLGRWPASEFKKIGVMLKGIQKALRFYPWHFALCIFSFFPLVPIHNHVFEIFMISFEKGFKGGNSFKQFSGHWIAFNYITAVFFVLIIPLQLKLVNYREDNYAE